MWGLKRTRSSSDQARSKRALISKNMEIDDEIINEYLTKLPVEILTMLNDLEPLFDKIKKI